MLVEKEKQFTKGVENNNYNEERGNENYNPLKQED